ncbi:MAG: hypothetical protein OK454_05960, partial [Thaumarchaeota archaeon]|nr:hypothetical protein [Nitrososphaerota archaeon]
DWILHLVSVRDSHARLAEILRKTPELHIALLPVPRASSMIHVALSLDRGISPPHPLPLVVRFQKSLVLRSTVRIFPVIAHWVERGVSASEAPQVAELFADLRIGWWLVPRTYLLDSPERHRDLAVMVRELRHPTPFRVACFSTQGEFDEYRKGLPQQHMIAVVRAYSALQMFYMLRDASRWKEVLLRAAFPEKHLNWEDACLTDGDIASFWLLRLFASMDGEDRAMRFCAAVCEADVAVCRLLHHAMGREIRTWNFPFGRKLFSHQTGIISAPSALFDLRPHKEPVKIIHGELSGTAHIRERAFLVQ